MSKRASKIARILVMAIAVIVLACAISFTNVQRNGASAVSAARYSSDYSSKAESIVAGDALNERIAEEGMVLLKNDNNVLPLSPGGVGTDATRVTLFGYKSVTPDGGASPNDTDASAGVTIITSDVYSSLANSGYRTNPVVRAAYTSWMSESANNTSDFAAMTEEDPTGIKRFTDDVAYSFADYDDAAIVVLSATGASSVKDGRELDKNAAIDGDSTSHAHQIDKVQLNLLRYVDQHFDKVITLINDSTPMELGYINQYSDAVMLIGNPGATGFNAIGRVLSGAVNPSGRLPDIYPADLTKDPTYDNFGRNGIEPVAAVTDESGNVTSKAIAGGNQYVDEDGNPLYSYFTDYEEGIYVGYRYYETMAAQLGGEGEAWYQENVTYSFGEGLSYSDFTWTAANQSKSTTLTADSEIVIDVTVANGADSLPGKDVVELYYSAPYTDTAKLEKPAAVLGDFAKTDTLAAGDSQTLRLKLDARDMASYDVNRQHDGNLGAWVLEAGEYVVSLRTNSHDVKDNLTFTFDVASDIVYGESDQTGLAIKNAFDDNLAGLGALDTRDKHVGAGDFKELSRKDMNANGSHLPKQRTLYDYDGNDQLLETKNTTTAANVLTEEEHEEWDVTIALGRDSDGDGIKDYDEGKPWYTATAPTFSTEDNRKTPVDAGGNPDPMMLSELIGADFNDSRWDILLDQLTVDELVEMMTYGGFKSNAIPFIGKPETLDTDSPLGWSGNGTAGQLSTRFATEPVIAATWNKELAYEMGKMIGDQGLWGRSDTGTAVKAYTGWYGPGCNMHRSPFLGRYTEYYSEDPYLTGMMAANATLGAQEKGCYSFVKHFAAHEDGSTDRGIMADGMFGGNGIGSKTSGLSIWASEQALREIYLKPFQLAVEVGNATATMASFSRFGTEWAGGSYGLLTQCLRNEWGFTGFVVTDIAIYDFLNAEQMLRAGCDLVLDGAVYGLGVPNTAILTDEMLQDSTTLAGLRRMAHNVLYTVANSNAMDVPHGAAVVYAGSTLEKATVGESYRAVVTTATLNTVYDYGALVSYSLYSGNLPEGMTFSNGMLSGTPTAAGTYSFTVAAQATNFETAYATFTVVVESNAATDAITGATDDINTKVDGAVSDLNGRIDATDEKVDGVNSMVTVALVFAIIAAVGAIASVVLVIIKKK